MNMVYNLLFYKCFGETLIYQNYSSDVLIVNSQIENSLLTKIYFLEALKILRLKCTKN